jgi:hypothetical protein
VSQVRGGRNLAAASAAVIGYSNGRVVSDPSVR